MPGLLFPIHELLDEIETVKYFAGKFLERDTTWTLDRLKEQLNALFSSGQPGFWRIDEDQPLRTKPTRRYLHGGGTGRFDVFAEFTQLWHLRPERQKKAVRLVGVASSRIQL